MQQLFESWSLSCPTIPRRTLLYSLEPIGIETAFIESLSSYVARLAEAHSVTVGDLVGRILSEIPNPKGTIVTPAARACRVGSHGFRACSYAVNGSSERTEKWVYALETATGRRDLRCLTLLPLRSALPEQVFRRYRAWCPACFEHWRALGQIIYEPLAWAFQVSSYCMVHKHPLRSDCHHCGWRLSPFGVLSRSGYCQHCGAWLGGTVAEEESTRPEPISQENFWASEQLGGLLVILSRAAPEVSQKSIRKSLAIYLKEAADGNVLALAEYIQCPRSILQDWLNGRTTPRLAGLLRTARALNVSVSSFFTQTGPIAIDIAAAKQAIAVAGERNVSPSRHAGEIRKALAVALSEDVPL